MHTISDKKKSAVGADKPDPWKEKEGERERGGGKVGQERLCQPAFSARAPVSHQFRMREPRPSLADFYRRAGGNAY